MRFIIITWFILILIGCGQNTGSTSYGSYTFAEEAEYPSPTPDPSPEPSPSASPNPNSDIN